MKRKGFTLIEILVACAIIIALAAGAIFGVYSLLQSGKSNKAKTDVATIDTALRQYYFDTGKMPSSLDVITVKDGSLGPWLDKDNLTDPWGSEYYYALYGSGVYYVLSLGSDKELSTNVGSEPNAVGGDDIGVSCAVKAGGAVTYYDGQKYIYGQNN